VIGELTEWCNRPLGPVYPVVFVDAIRVKIRDGQVTNRPHLRSHRGHLRRGI
jgi:putative transposase